MKILLSLIALFLTLTITGCSGEEEDGVLGNHFYYYDLKVKFEDNSGQNILKSIECEDYSAIFGKSDTNNYPDWTFIARNIYSIDFDSKGPGWFHLIGPLHYVVIDNEEYMDLECYSMDGIQSSFSYTLSCEQIFGDKKTHKIEAFYSSKLPGEKYQTLTGVTFDSVEQKVEDNARVTITINR